MFVPTVVRQSHPVIIEGKATGACLVVNGWARDVEIVEDITATFAYRGGSGGLTPTLDALITDPDRCRRPKTHTEEQASQRYRWTAFAHPYSLVLREQTRPR